MKQNRKSRDETTGHSGEGELSASFSGYFTLQKKVPVVQEGRFTPKIGLDLTGKIIYLLLLLPEIETKSYSQ
jgi:hypothetical protein